MAGLTIYDPVTFSRAIASANIIAGDTISLRGGTYTLADMQINWHGISEAHITLTTYNNEQVIFQPTSGVRIMLITGDYIDITGNMIFDGAGVTQECIKITNAGAEVPTGILLSGLEIKNAPMQGVLISNNSTTATLTNLTIHDVGTTEDHHCIYVSDGTVTINGCECYNGAGHGIHVYGGHSTTTIYNNYCHNNHKAGIGVYSDTALVYNNICRSNEEAGIRIRYSAETIETYFNTLINNPLNVDIQAISLTTFTCKIHNNVCLNGNYGIYTQMEQAGLAADCVELYNNLTNGAALANILIFGAGDTDAVIQANNLTNAFTPVTNDGADVIDPTVGNPAIGAGVAVVGITTDYAGTARANPPTIGAYE